jgi:hypothetical protein
MRATERKTKDFWSKRNDASDDESMILIMMYKGSHDVQIWYFFKGHIICSKQYGCWKKKKESKILEMWKTFISIYFSANSRCCSKPFSDNWGHKVLLAEEGRIIIVVQSHGLSHSDNNVVTILLSSETVTGSEHKNSPEANPGHKSNAISS